MSLQEFIGYRSTEAISCDITGKPMYSMGITDEEIIRCRDCRYANSDNTKCNNKRWNTVIHGAYVSPSVNPDGFCAWAERDE